MAKLKKIPKKPKNPSVKQMEKWLKRKADIERENKHIQSVRDKFNKASR